MQGSDTVFWNFKDPADHKQYLKIHESLWRDIEKDVEKFATARAGQTGDESVLSGSHVWNDTVTRLYLEVGFELAKQQKLTDAERALNDSLRSRIARFFPNADPPLLQLVQQLVAKVRSKQQ